MSLVACRRRAVAGMLAAATLLAMACVPTRGGWDLDALVARERELAGIEAHRLGDLIPFPMLDAEGLRLVACRFADGERVRVAASGPDWPSDWASASVRALNQRLGAVRLEIAQRPESARAAGTAARSAESGPPRVVARTVLDGGEVGPSGLGDTLSACDVSPRSAGDPRPRGLITHAEIRMRRGGRDVLHHYIEATPEEWVGAFMHELAHALGFVGHAAAGDSVLVRDQHRLRSLGRAALADRPASDATLVALYTLAPGTTLGRAEPEASALDWIAGLERLRRDRRRAGRRERVCLASVGDEEARLVWHFDAGAPLTLRFPRWRRDLEQRRPIHAIPDAATRVAIRGLATD